MVCILQYLQHCATILDGTQNAGFDVQLFICKLTQLAFGIYIHLISFDHLIAYSEIHRESIQFRQYPFGSIWEILGIQWIERISKRFMGLQLNEEVILGRAA